MKSRYSTIIDLFLLQKDFYSKLTDKSMWLYIGILFVGIRDVFFSILSDGRGNGIFINSLVMDAKTVAVLVLVAVIIGLIDVLSFSYPVFDVIKHFKKKE